MYCKYCGQEIDDNTKFCSKCGKALETPTSKNENNSKYLVYEKFQNESHPEDTIYIFTDKSLITQSSEYLYRDMTRMQITKSISGDTNGANFSVREGSNYQKQFINVGLVDALRFEKVVSYANQQIDKAHGARDNSSDFSKVYKMQYSNIKKTIEKLSLPHELHKMHIDVILSVIGASLWILSSFLPYLSSGFLGIESSDSLMDFSIVDFIGFSLARLSADFSKIQSLFANSKDGWVFGVGWLFIILAVAIFVELYLHIDNMFYMHVGIGIALNIFLIKSTSDMFKILDVYSSFMHKGFGYYLLIVGSIFLVAGTILFILRRREEKNTKRVGAL